MAKLNEILAAKSERRFIRVYSKRKKAAIAKSLVIPSSKWRD
jgi:hypothetical protein